MERRGAGKRRWQSNRIMSPGIYKGYNIGLTQVCAVHCSVKQSSLQTAMWCRCRHTQGWSTITGLFWIYCETKVHQWCSSTFFLTCRCHIFSLWYHTILFFFFSPSSTYSQLPAPLASRLSSLLLPFLQSLPHKLLAIQFREAAGSIARAPHTAIAAGLDFLSPPLAPCVLDNQTHSLVLFFFSNYTSKSHI